MSALFVRDSWRDIKGNNSPRPGREPRGPVCSLVYCRRGTQKKQWPPACHRLPKPATDLPPSARTCHDLPGTVTFERSFSQRTAGPVTEADFLALGDVSVAADVRVESIVGGPRRDTGWRVGKEGETPCRTVTVCHIVRTDFETRLLRHFDNGLAGDFESGEMDRAGCAMLTVSGRTGNAKARQPTGPFAEIY